MFNVRFAIGVARKGSTVGKTRKGLRHGVKHKAKTEISNGSLLRTWLVTWAAEVINPFRIQDSGRTACS